MRDLIALDPVGRRGLAADVAGAAVFAAIAVPLHWDGQGPAAGIAALLVAVGLSCRRVAPTAMVLLTVASALIQVVTGEIVILACLAYAAVFYVLGGHPDRRIRFGSLAAGLAGSVIAAFELPATYGTSPSGAPSQVVAGLFGFALAAIVLLGGWVVGYIRFQRRSVERARVAETIADLERRRLLDRYAEQAERTRLARDMHDVVAHSLTVVIAQTEGARYAVADAHSATDRISADRALQTVTSTARDALADVRTLLDQLRRDDDADIDDHADTSLLSRMRAAGMTIDHRVDGDPYDAAPTTHRIAHRVLTEALTNALKYGDLTEPVVVRHEWTGGCTLTVHNAVSGSAGFPGGGGHGIPGMAEQVAPTGGTLTSGPDLSGWLVELVLPSTGKGDRR